MRMFLRVPAIVLFLAALAFSAWGSGDLPPTEPFRVTFSTNEDYDTSLYASDEGLAEVEKDFQLVKELGLSHLRVSFSWSNYERLKGNFQNLEWLHQFVDLADKYAITLMPYLCYAPDWVGEFGEWNDKPKDNRDWYNFVHRMVSEFKSQIHYWEIWNEEDLQQWFFGTMDDYIEFFKAGASAVRDADPTAKILVGGLTQPLDTWVAALLDKGCGDLFDVVPIHCYAESWSGRAVEDYLYEGGTDFDLIADLLHTRGRGQPIWLNEIGYPTIGRKTEIDQARFIWRAVATLLATRHISLISWYEIKDFRQDTSLGVIGDANNYHLGLTYADRRKKLGFAAYKTMVSLFNEEDLTYLGPAVRWSEEKKSAHEPRIYLHAFRRESDGRVLLFVWLYGPIAGTRVTLNLPAAIVSASEYALDGARTEVSGFAGRRLKGIELKQDEPRLFELILADR